jgi:DNA processing protein
VIGQDRLRAVRAASDADPAVVAARVGWSIVTEPGDSVAGELIAELGAARSLELAVDAACHGRRARLRAAAASGAVEDPDEAARRVERGLERWAPRLRALDVDRAVDAAAAVGARLLVPGDDGWPTRLDDLGEHAPLVLWCRSRTSADLEAPSLAVVGSRANTTYGTEVTADIASAATAAGVTVVSGGAYGIDAVAHRVTIGLGGVTLAVLAGGIDQLYPAGNIELLRSVSTNGALLAESPPGMRPTRWRFLARNRLIAALTSATVVVEAGARSGALNTANHAAQLGRPVFAVPGPISSATSVGCHRLVASGRADLLVRPTDASDAVLRPFGPDSPQPLGGTNDDERLVRVLDALDRRRSLGVEELARRSGLAPTDVADSLALAELQGRAVRSVEGWRAA